MLVEVTFTLQLNYQRLLDLAENDRAIVVSHRDSDLRYKPNKEIEFIEDKFSMTRYTDSLARYLKFQHNNNQFYLNFMV